jgi:serine/threonine protein phosphatase PrpC
MHLNFAQRSFKWPGIAGARVQGGLSPYKSAEGIGDCVLLNFDNGLFAVSDSSDRRPGQSREFLLQFDRMVSTSSGIRLDRTVRALEVRGITEKIESGCEKILEAMRGSESCTFTGIQILRTDKGLTALVFHTGDSRLYEYAPLSRKLSPLAAQNFWMIGKTVRLYQTTEFEVRPQRMFILSTDGVFNGTDEPTRQRRLSEIIHQSQVEDIPDKIMKMVVPAEGFRDDAALVSLSPQSLKFARIRIIMGGTTALQEREYADRCRSNYYADANVRIIEATKWVDHVV